MGPKPKREAAEKWGFILDPWTRSECARLEQGGIWRKEEIHTSLVFALMLCAGIAVAWMGGDYGASRSMELFMIVASILAGGLGLMKSFEEKRESQTAALFQASRIAKESPKVYFAWVSPGEEVRMGRFEKSAWVAIKESRFQEEARVLREREELNATLNKTGAGKKPLAPSWAGKRI